MAAIIHVKLTGEGDFGPIDLECAIPPARLPLVMAALFGPAGGSMDRQAAIRMQNPGDRQGTRGDAGGAYPHHDSAQNQAFGQMPAQDRVPMTGTELRPLAGANSANANISADGQAYATDGLVPVVPSAGASVARSSDPPGSGGVARDVAGVGGGMAGVATDAPMPVSASRDVGAWGPGGRGYGAQDGGSWLSDPGSFLTGFIGTLGDLVNRLQPRGFSETILIAAIWLHYRDGRNTISRDDIRRLLKRQEHLRMPRNFGRDFQVAVARGYVAAVDGAAGEYAVSRAGYQWFHSVCIK